MVVAPRPGSGPNTTDTGTSDSRYYSQNLRISFVSNPQSPTSSGRGSKTRPSGDEALAMSDHDIGMGTLPGSDKYRDRESEGRQEEGRVEGGDGEYIVGEAL